MTFALTPDREKALQELLARYPTRRAAAIPLLHMCQQQNGWVSAGVIEFVARRLDLNASIVQGIVTFYTMFHQRPVAPNVVSICRTLSCELRGAKAVEEHIEKRLGCRSGETSADGRFTLRRAECLAACGQGPMMQVNDRYYEDLTFDEIDRIVDAHARSAGGAGPEER